VFGMSNSVVEWYRGGARGGASLSAGAIADAIEAIVFDGIDTPAASGGARVKP
jgi:hypothetical protein